MFLMEIMDVKIRESQDISLLTDAELKEMLLDLCSEMNWQYDIDPLKEDVFSSGQYHLNKIETYLIELFRRDKMAAINLWETECPFATQGIIPNFLRTK